MRKFQAFNDNQEREREKEMERGNESFKNQSDKKKEAWKEEEDEGKKYYKIYNRLCGGSLCNVVETAPDSQKIKRTFLLV